MAVSANVFAMRRTTLFTLVVIFAPCAHGQSSQAPRADSARLHAAIAVGRVRGTIGTDTVDRWPSARTLTYPRGARVTYSLAPAPNHRRFTVHLFAASTAVDSATSGVITMDRDYTLTSMAERIPVLTAQNRAAFQMEVQTLRARNPAPLIPRLLMHSLCLEQWYGQDRGGNLAEDASAAARDSVSDSVAVKRFESALETYFNSIGAMALLSSPTPTCTLPRPADALPTPKGPSRPPTPMPVPQAEPRGKPAPAGAVGPENKRMYDIWREMLTSKTPIDLYQQSMDELMCLEKLYGSTRSDQLARAAHDKAMADGGGPAAQQALSARLAGASIEARDCTRPKPK